MTELATEQVPQKFACGEAFVPKSRYIDPEFLNLELERLFPGCGSPRVAKKKSRLPAASTSTRSAGSQLPWCAKGR